MSSNANLAADRPAFVAHLECSMAGAVDEGEGVVLSTCATGLEYPMPPAARTLDRRNPIAFDAP